MARRSRPAPPPRRSPLAALPPLLLLLALGGGGVFLFRDRLRALLLPAPLPGLNARIDSDGRLLGHFPYPEAPAASLVEVGGGQRLRPEAAAALEAMRRDAASQGVELVVLSAFRSLALQRQLFFDVMAERNQSSRERARVSAPPGFSEHSTGYAVDLGDGRAPGTNVSPRFDETAAYGWLQANAARYHFALSFPQHNAQGVNYEPWHWRFEGSTEALRLFEPAMRLSR
jgi:D-alanyl-D-alanine carboxypeptidase